MSTAAISASSVFAKSGTRSSKSLFTLQWMSSPPAALPTAQDTYLPSRLASRAQTHVARTSVTLPLPRPLKGNHGVCPEICPSDGTLEATRLTSLQFRRFRRVRKVRSLVEGFLCIALLKLFDTDASRSPRWFKWLTSNSTCV